MWRLPSPTIRLLTRQGLQVSLPEQTTELSVQCRKCNSTEYILVGTSDLIAWRAGMLIQYAFPYLDIPTRELLISNTCNKCWIKIFGSGKASEAQLNRHRKKQADDYVI